MIKGQDGKLQPFLIVIGQTNDTITSTYVFVNDVLYPVTNFLKGLSLLFKIFQVLNFEYPEESKQIWYFIEEFFFGFKAANNKTSDCISFLAELDANGTNDSDTE